MRDLFLAPLLLAIIIQTFRTPSAGVLGWTWLTLMTPQKLIWGMLSSMPLNLIMALATLPMIAFTRDKRKIPINAVTVLWLLFFFMVTISTILALSPSMSWEMWNRCWKLMLLGVLVPVLLTSARNIQALIWVMVISLGYFGVKGGLFTILFGSGGHVIGPPGTGLEDNNYLALALCLTLPLMNYLRLQAESRSVRLVLMLCMISTAFGIMGTFSRGGLIGLGTMAGYLWWKSPRRLPLAIGTVIVLIPALYLMPPSWYDRMSTLKDASNQTTFLTRWDAWKVNWNIAVSRPLTGGGFNASQDGGVYRRYSYGQSMYAGPDGETGGHASHSIYFEVLGDHGFIGLGLYLGLLLATLAMLRRVRKSAKAIPALAWVTELATMIQVSFLAFFVAGAALSMAYYDFVFLFIGITLALDQLIKEYNKGGDAAGDQLRSSKNAGKNEKWRAPALHAS